jgi:O-methyltransferase
MKRSDLKQLFAGKKLIGYGAGVAFLGAQEAWPLPISYVVDDTSAFQGQTIRGVPIEPASKLASEPKDKTFVIIYGCGASSVLGISRALNALGFRFIENYLDVSYLHFCSMGEKLSQALGISPSYDKFVCCRQLSLYAAAKNLSTLSGTWVFTELVDHLLPHLNGDIAELGVYNGGNALAALLASPVLRQRRYHLLDSFEGFPELSSRDPESWRGDFADVDFRSLCDTFSPFSGVRIHKGYFSETLPRLPEASYPLVYIDCDLYNSTIECLEYFYKRLPAGAALFFHDYWVPSEPLPKSSRDVFTGVRAAVDEFLGEASKQLIVFPETTHALLLKR